MSAAGRAGSEVSLWSPRLERALRFSSVAHQGQTRRGSDVPYVAHVVAVAMILDRLGYPETVIVAALLHDVVEDTEITLDAVQVEFGSEVAALVAASSERKTDAEGRKRPWIDRKTEHLDALASATAEARAIALADKLHNLLSIETDIAAGREIWSKFHADRERVLWYYRSAAERLGHGDPSLERLAGECLRLVEAFESQSE